MANGLTRERREGGVFCRLQQVSQAAAAGVGGWEGETKEAAAFFLMCFTLMSPVLQTQTKYRKVDHDFY